MLTFNSETEMLSDPTVHHESSKMVRTCLERLSLVWACWVCCASVRPCCPAALLRRVWGWLGACSSVEQEALDELSSTEAAGQGKTTHLQGCDQIDHRYQCYCGVVKM